MRLQNGILSALAIFVLLPFVVLLYHFRISFQIDWAEFFWVFRNSFFQSFCSASLALLLGLFLSFVFPTEKNSFSLLIYLSSLLPFFTPPLFLLIALMNLIQPFPLGIASGIGVHVLVYSGFVAYQIFLLSQSRMSGYASHCRLMGTSFLRYFFSVFLPLLKRDLGLLWIFVFFGSFTSFAIPMMVGGLQTSSMEVLVYEIIRYQANWGSAVALSLIQAIVVFSLGYFLQESIRGEIAESLQTKTYTFVKGCFVFPLIVAILFFGLFKDIDWSRLSVLSSSSLFISRVSQTFLLGIFTSLFVYFFLVLLAFSWRQGFWEKFFLRYSGPTPVLTTFAFLLLFPTIHFGFLVQAVFALTVVSLPLFMKTDFLSNLKKLQSQREMSIVLGANAWTSFLLVIWPQIHTVLVRISAYVGIWSMGDFAISRILATNDRTLALHIDSLVSNYRMNESVHFAIMLLGFMMIYFILWKGIGYVLGQKFSQTLWRLYT